MGQKEKADSNQRDFPRFTIELTGWFRPLGSTLVFSTVIVANVGGGGICFLAKRPLKVGSKIDLVLNLEERQREISQRNSLVLLWKYKD